MSPATHLAPRPVRSLLAVAALSLPAAALAIDYGPFSLNGFAKAEWGRTSNVCTNCARFPNEDKQRLWADELVPGRPYKTTDSNLTLFQPTLSAKFDLGDGFKLSAGLSQRWRDGRVDIPGYWYDRSITLSHENWGSVRIGSMTTRGWALADYPYGTNLGMADFWGSSGAGYGLMTRAIRYTSNKFDVLDGDLVLEATYDQGNTAFKRNKPQFFELFAQYARGPLVVDAMYQEGRNGTPMAWAHGPFTGLTPWASDDAKLGGSGQSMAMVMARYQWDNRIELTGGLRRNRWSGAYATITTPGANGNPDLWNMMFNVDWSRDLGGGVYKGYPATSTDVLLGVRYRQGPWTGSVGLAHLGKASTSNPSERGQSNSATVATAGISYELRPGLQLYAQVGAVQYGRLGLSPMSMPGNAAFTQVDSRVTRDGNWLRLGAVYVF